MHRTLIIEDRSARKEKFLDSDTKANLDAYKSELTFVEGDDYTNIKMNLTNDVFENFDLYSVIISHRSAFEHGLLDKLKEYCKKNKKPLVFFSGGISTSYYDESSFPFLTINSKDFYSNNLIKFLEKLKLKNEVELPILQYGENWEINYLMEARNSLANYLFLNKDVKQVSRNVIENEIKFNSRVLHFLKERTENKEWINEGIREDGFNRLNEILENLKGEINEYIKKL